MGDRYSGQTPQDSCVRGLLPLGDDEARHSRMMIDYSELYGVAAALVDSLRRSIASGEPLEPDQAWWLAQLERHVVPTARTPHSSAYATWKQAHLDHIERRRAEQTR